MDEKTERSDVIKEVEVHCSIAQNMSIKFGYIILKIDYMRGVFKLSHSTSMGGK